MHCLLHLSSAASTLQGRMQGPDVEELLPDDVALQCVALCMLPFDTALLCFLLCCVLQGLMQGANVGMQCVAWCMLSVCH